jgi:hypothetical protein
MALGLPVHTHLRYICDVEILDKMHFRGMGYERVDCTMMMPQILVSVYFNVIGLSTLISACC